MPCSARLKQANGSYTAPMQAIWVILIIGVGAYLFLARERVVQPPRSGRMKRRILFAMVLFGFALCATGATSFLIG